MQRWPVADAHFDVRDGGGVCALANGVLVVIHDFYGGVQFARDGGDEGVNRAVAHARCLMRITVDDDLCMHFNGFGT